MWVRVDGVKNPLQPFIGGPLAAAMGRTGTRSRCINTTITQVTCIRYHNGHNGRHTNLHPAGTHLVLERYFGGKGRDGGGQGGVRVLQM